MKFWIKLKKIPFFFDVIYDPNETIFLNSIKKNGLKGINGILMNLDQAVLAFNYVTSNKFQLSEIKEAMQN